VTASVSATGGSGGGCGGNFPYNALFPGLPVPTSGGNGQPVSLTNMVNGSILLVVTPGVSRPADSPADAGQVTITQSATGGSGGGNAFGNGMPGAGANSVLNYSSIGWGGGQCDGTFSATANATGGNGGGGGGDLIMTSDTTFVVATGNGGVGADGVANTDLLAPSPGPPASESACVASANARGGVGGSSIGGTAGNGGNASAFATAATITAGVPETATANAYGGTGGGGGGWVTYLEPMAGEWVPGSGAAGGNATASANALPFTGLATATATAVGGNGGYAYYGTGYSGGAGGSASATAQGTSIFEALALTAQATGGQGGVGSYGAANGPGGSATAIVEGSATGTIQLYSPGLANGNPGTASLSVGYGTITMGPPGERISGTLTVTIPGTLTLTGGQSGYNLVVGDGTNASILQLTTAIGGTTSVGSLTVSANSALNIFTDSSGTTTVGEGNTNNGTLSVTGTGSTTIGGVAGSGTLTIGEGTNATTLQAFPK